MIGLSEHWLHSFEINAMSNIHPDYCYSIECVPDRENSTFCYPCLLRGHGGVALLWHKSLNSVVSQVPFPRNDRIVGLRIKCHPSDILVFSVYLPTRSGSTDPFREMLDLMDSIFVRHPDCITLFMGDFNADIGSPMSPPNEQGKILIRYLDRWSYVSTHLFLHSDGPIFTYESDAHHSTSVIDHILCPSSFIPRIEHSSVLSHHPLNTSDHIAVHAVISISLSPPPAIRQGHSVPADRSILVSVTPPLEWLILMWSISSLVT